ncbi:MAG: integral rane protein [Candidatus Solibacter sp.]|nr:integral rane protein [Candidatus Solibacter sp.]
MMSWRCGRHTAKLKTMTSYEVKRGIKLEYFTIAYNLIEAAVGLIAGIFAGSVALVGFGLDSVIEVTSGATLLWRLRGDARREPAAIRIVGVCFLVLAAYVAYEAGEALVSHRSPERSVPGIALAAVSMIVMPLLSRAKRQVAGRISSAALHADARQTDFCAWLSAILLAGLLLNALLGWWWADPAAALVMTPIIAREGWNALRGKPCGDCC